MDQADTDEPLVSDEMIGYMVVFGLDFVLLAGILWVFDVVSGTVFAAVAGAVAAVYLVWIALRWYTLRSGEPSEADPVETLKQRYAVGELSDEEFEQKLNQLMDAETDQSAADQESEEQLFERSN